MSQCQFCKKQITWKQEYTGSKKNMKKIGWIPYLTKTNTRHFAENCSMGKYKKMTKEESTIAKTTKVNKFIKQNIVDDDVLTIINNQKKELI